MLPNMATRFPCVQSFHLVFLEGAWGQLLLGPYHGILHGNMAVLRGQRLLITFYCKTTILEKKA